MTFIWEQIDILKDNPEETETGKFPITLSHDNLADMFTRKRPKIMWPTDEEILRQAKGSTDDQSDEEDHHMPTNYRK